MNKSGHRHSIEVNQMNIFNLSNKSTKDNPPDFLVGDVVVFTDPTSSNELHEIEAFQPVEYYWLVGGGIVHKNDIRTATVAELNAKRRLTSAEQALAEVS